MTRRALLVALIAAAACAPKGDADVSADSTAVALPAESAVTVRDSATGRDTAAAKSKGTSPGTTTPGTTTPIVGRDSAFGPTYMIDSTGKLIPIQKKKP